MSDDPIAKELIYSLKLNFWMHNDLKSARVKKLSPMFQGSRESV